MAFNVYYGLNNILSVLLLKSLILTKVFLLYFNYNYSNCCVFIVVIEGPLPNFLLTYGDTF